ncbi:hypothetical protein F5050DRAFT_1715295 [Lentinula boryana]|uniref:Uncharacterized protein n=1 Tax=Lentinula boryana TaxID=40481 RepID=A0ABQ8Q144_9AGAR|nr:hypothetical protein F5050DRAFT_1715295 [Lentinula boryana]
MSDPANPYSIIPDPEDINRPTQAAIPNAPALNDPVTYSMVQDGRPCNCSSPPLYISIDNSDLLDRFKDTYKNDTEWRTSNVAGNSDFNTEHGHDSVIGGHPGRRRTE